MGIAEYVSAYAGSAGRIAQMARDIAERAKGDVRQARDESHARAQLKLAELGAVDRVAQARRGPILLSDFLDTRILELVVHTRDLQHSLPDQPTPRILASARNPLVIVLPEIMTSRAADPVGAVRAASLLGPEDFIDLTTGRMPAPAGLPEPLASAPPVL